MSLRSRLDFELSFSSRLFKCVVIVPQVNLDFLCLKERSSFASEKRLTEKSVLLNSSHNSRSEVLQSVIPDAVQGIECDTNTLLFADKDDCNVSQDESSTRARLLQSQ